MDGDAVVAEVQLVVGADLLGLDVVAHQLDLDLGQVGEVAGVVEHVDGQVAVVVVDHAAELLAILQLDAGVLPVGPDLGLLAVGGQEVVGVGLSTDHVLVTVDLDLGAVHRVDADEGVGGDGLLLEVLRRSRADGHAGLAGLLDAQAQLVVRGAEDVAVQVVEGGQDQSRRLDDLRGDPGRVVAEDHLHQGAEGRVGRHDLAVAAGAVEGDRLLGVGHEGLDHGVGQVDLAVADLVDQEDRRVGVAHAVVLADVDAVDGLGGRQLVHLQVQPGGDVDRLADHDDAVEGLVGDGLDLDIVDVALGSGVHAEDGGLVVGQGAHWHTSCFCLRPSLGTTWVLWVSIHLAEVTVTPAAFLLFYSQGTQRSYSHSPLPSTKADCGRKKECDLTRCIDVRLFAQPHKS